MKTINMDVWWENDDPNEWPVTYSVSVVTAHDVDNLEEFEHIVKKLAKAILEDHASAGDPNG